ncbi:hypothetical protein AX16_006907 [Volvariella volvacea WC 439]|nr:hypothetical protein AX16_006907 [Volvariella volvacea WC 439]
MPTVDTTKNNFVLVIHGGAGTILREKSTPERQAAFKAALTQALHAGFEVLKDGGEAMDAAVAAVASMEDCPLFNAGKGAVFNIAGKNELEASIMLSKPPASHPEIPSSRRGLGLTLLTRARNPSKLARALYLSPTLAPHAFLSGSTAEAISESLGETLVDPSYFFTEHRWKEHRTGLGLPVEPSPNNERIEQDDKVVTEAPLDEYPKGTVGAVALDIRGCIAAVTSTGGRTNKLVGRIGDTPLMAAGFWAEEWTYEATGLIQNLSNRISGRPQTQTQGVGVSGTGNGDFFIRSATAVSIAHRVRWANESLHDAAISAVEDLGREGGEGGVIALDTDGNVVMPMNSPGMYRGVIRPDGIPHTAIFNDDVLT